MQGKQVHVKGWAQGTGTNTKDFTETSAPEVYRHVSKPQPEAASDSEISQLEQPSSCLLHWPEQTEPQTAAASRTARTWEM